MTYGQHISCCLLQGLVITCQILRSEAQHSWVFLNLSLENVLKNHALLSNKAV